MKTPCESASQTAARLRRLWHGFLAYWTRRPSSVSGWSSVKVDCIGKHWTKIYRWQGSWPGSPMYLGEETDYPPEWMRNKTTTVTLVERILDNADEPEASMEMDALWAKVADDRLASYRRGDIRAVALSEVLAKYQLTLKPK